MDLSALWKKYKSVVLYLVFGALTTLVNIVCYWLCAHPLGIGTILSTVIAWIASVIFAYITNRIWVFESKSTAFLDIFSEFIKFVSCRLATGLMDLFFMWLFVDVLSWNDMLIKIGSNILVIILNYVASKFFIFTKKED